MTSILAQPAVQIAALVLSGLFFLNQTRKQGLILSLLCMVAWLGVVVIMVDIIAQEQPDVGSAINKRIIAAPRSWLHIVINEHEFVESEPIIETITEHFVIVLPNEDPAPAPVQVSASWGSVAPAVARWQPHINEAIAHCGLVTPGYDPALLMAAIVTQESSGNPSAMGAAHDTGLGQVVNNSHPLFPNRPSQEQLLDPQFNLNFAACLLRDNLKRTGTVEAAVNAYNGNGIHGGRTYAQIIFGHYYNALGYNGFKPIANAPVDLSQSTNFGSSPVSDRQ